MTVRPADIRTELIRQGKKHFLLHGFEGSSLRQICNDAGVTTGAFYSNFEKKEDLFAVIVEPTVRDFRQMYEQVDARDLADLDSSLENEKTSIMFLAGHRDEFRLLFECSKGTPYEGFKERLIEDVFMPIYQEFFDKYGGGHVDPALVRIILMMKFEQYMELAYGGYSPEEVSRLIAQLSVFSKEGLKALVRTLAAESGREVSDQAERTA